jgi:hypothetical protein
LDRIDVLIADANQAWARNAGIEIISPSKTALQYVSSVVFKARLLLKVFLTQSTSLRVNILAPPDSGQRDSTSMTASRHFIGISRDRETVGWPFYYLLGELMPPNTVSCVLCKLAAVTRKKL